jgi:CAAX prenyl protease-like protein
MTAVDAAVGIVLAALWMMPYVLFPDLRPAGETESFDRNLAGATFVPLVLSLRMIGYALVTPFMEELFMRSFLMRYVDSYDSDRDFTELPIGTFNGLSFIVVVAVFLATHQTWEWWVMLPWAVLTNLWFYYRKDLFALVVVHSATNATILISVILWGDAYGFWFFV